MSTIEQKYNKWKARKFLEKYNAYDTYKNTKQINLINEELKEFPKEIFYLKDLEGLHLNNNDIKKFPIKKMLKELPNLRSVFLGGNPISVGEERKINKEIQNKDILVDLY